MDAFIIHFLEWSRFRHKSVSPAGETGRNNALLPAENIVVNGDRNAFDTVAACFLHLQRDAYPLNILDSTRQLYH